MACCRSLQPSLCQNRPVMRGQHSYNAKPKYSVVNFKEIEMWWKVTKQWEQKLFSLLALLLLRCFGQWSMRWEQQHFPSVLAKQAHWHKQLLNQGIPLASASRESMAGARWVLLQRLGKCTTCKIRERRIKVLLSGNTTFNIKTVVSRHQVKVARGHSQKC